jgi:hypothetical protein
MGKFFLGLLIGAIVGAALIFFFLGGAPRALKAPGAPIKPPDAGSTPAGTATVVVKQEFFNEVLGTIFRDMNAPAFPLSLAGNIEQTNPSFTKFGLLQQSGECGGQIVLKPEGSGVNTGVRFENGQILAPLAFSGSTAVFGNCINFSGWAQADLQLRYDEPQQAVLGQINVQTVNLDGVSPVASGFVTPLVQSTINSRVNPIPILRGEQLSLNLPIAATNGNLNARVQDVRAEVKDNGLNLYLIYNFTGTK